MFGCLRSWFSALFVYESEGCSIKQVFILDQIKVFVLDLNFLAKINEDFN